MLKPGFNCWILHSVIIVIVVCIPLQPSEEHECLPLQTEHSAAAVGFLALFRGISPAKSPGEGSNKRVASASAIPVADLDSDVERAVREKMERHRAQCARRKRRAAQREE